MSNMLAAQTAYLWLIVLIPLIPATILIARYAVLAIGLFAGWAAASIMALLMLLYLIPRDRWQAKEIAKGWQRWHARKAIKLQDGTVIQGAIVMRKRISGAWLYSRIDE